MATKVPFEERFGSRSQGAVIDAAFAGFAREHLISRGAFEAAVSGVRTRPLELVRVLWQGTSRRVVVRRAPTASRSRTLDEPLDPAGFDPWAEESRSLPATTRRLVRCAVCSGEKKVVCPACGGLASVRCAECSGTGRAISRRSGRAIHCPGCRGRGAAKCPCRDGRVTCGTCAGKGRADEWLEVVEFPFERVTTSGDAELARVLADDGPGRSLVPARTWSGSAVNVAPPDLRERISRPRLAVSLDPREDRLRAIGVEVFESELHTVEYRLCGLGGTVEVQGWDLRPLPTPASREPLRRRLRWMTAGAFAALGAGLALAIGYGARHPFFFTTPNFLWLLLFALLSSLAAVPLLAALARPAGRRHLAPAALLLGLVALGQTGLAASGGPRVEHARELAASGRIREALAETTACADLGIDAAAASAFHDDLQLAAVEEIGDPEEAWKAVELPFLSDEGREQARAHALEVTLRHTEALQQAGNLSASGKLLRLVPDDLDDEPRVHRIRWELQVLRTTELWEVAHAGDDLEARLAACPSLRREAARLDSFAEPPEPAPIRLTQVEALCERLVEQREAEIARQRAAAERELRRAERERRSREQARASSLRAWASAPLLCRDGTLSPSCVCGGSRRGCCSHHGGVAGCSAAHPSP